MAAIFSRSLCSALDDPRQFAFQRRIQRKLRPNKIGVPAPKLLPVADGGDVDVRRDFRDARAARLARQRGNRPGFPYKDLRTISRGDVGRGNLLRVDKHFLRGRSDQDITLELCGAAAGKEDQLAEVAIGGAGALRGSERILQFDDVALFQPAKRSWCERMS